LELIGSANTMREAVQCLSALRRAALVGLTAESISIFPYTELIHREGEIIGVSIISRLNFRCWSSSFGTANFVFRQTLFDLSILTRNKSPRPSTHLRIPLITSEQ